MAIQLTDLLPTDQEGLQKETAYLCRPTKLSFLGKQKANEISSERPDKPSILDLPLESELELAIARVTRSREEIDMARKERGRRITLNHQVQKNQWAKKIKSRSYRKSKREERVAKAAALAEVQHAVTSGVDAIDTIDGNEVGLVDKNRIVDKSLMVNNGIIDSGISIPEVSEPNTKPKPLDIFQSYAQPIQHTQIEEILEINTDFDEEKQQEIAKDLPKEEERVLPGWNSWGGEDIKPVKTSANTTLYKRSGIELRKRKDFKVSHVIYNERATQTRNAKYAIKALPQGFKSEEEYQELLAFQLDRTKQPISLLNKLIREEKNLQ
ncbi:hypothetical protein NEHOM01_0335 [Nematocida homosporus]|uniref:uncharacterized protein n=1 Tax=Nematocida homosporus TaxID=1912981 RepID=UPI00221E8279|nr:uncharacterized protein NEHOM01_0335 [Nematocida homosporus]KAI5184733.1 hypothetical protein NEHOM01_0335 [Nematocida homosporus]